MSGITNCSTHSENSKTKKEFRQTSFFPYTASFLVSQTPDFFVMPPFAYTDKVFESTNTKELHQPIFFAYSKTFSKKQVRKLCDMLALHV